MVRLLRVDVQFISFLKIIPCMLSCPPCIGKYFQWEDRAVLMLVIMFTSPGSRFLKAEARFPNTGHPAVLYVYFLASLQVMFQHVWHQPQRWPPHDLGPTTGLPVRQNLISRLFQLKADIFKYSFTAQAFYLEHHSHPCTQLSLSSWMRLHSHHDHYVPDKGFC